MDSSKSNNALNEEIEMSNQIVSKISNLVELGENEFWLVNSGSQIRIIASLDGDKLKLEFRDNICIIDITTYDIVECSSDKLEYLIKSTKTELK